MCVYESVFKNYNITIDNMSKQFPVTPTNGNDKVPSIGSHFSSYVSIFMYKNGLQQIFLFLLKFTTIL